MSKRLDCELGRIIGQRHYDEGARADREIGKGDALAYASGHELGLEIATVLLLLEILLWRRQGRSRRLRRDAVHVHGLSKMMGFITLPGGVGAWLPPQARANLSGRRSGTLEPVGGRAPGSKKTIGFFSKTFITKSFYSGLRPQKVFLADG